MEGICEPVPAVLARLLRRAVLDHVTTEHRRRFAPLLHAGVPGGAAEVFVPAPGERLDHALRADVVAALLRRTRSAGAEPLLWLTRPGPLELQDVDAAWLCAARTASAEAEVDVDLVVVTRRGWVDPRTGVRREWKRLRRR